MKQLFIPLFLFLFLVLEGVALELLPMSLIKGELVIVPHWVLVILVFVGIFYDREDTYFSVLYGLVFGLLIDIVYTGVLGVYMFTYALSIYIIHGLTKMLHANFSATLLLGTMALILTEIFINVIFSVVGISEMEWSSYLLFRLLPTVLANVLLLLALYPLIKKKFVGWKKERKSENSTFL